MEDVCRLYQAQQACPKDWFLLLRIDQLIDSTSRHQILNLMDIFIGYNQIIIAKTNKKIIFITDQGIYYYQVMLCGLKNALSDLSEVGMFHHLQY